MPVAKKHLSRVDMRSLAAEIMRIETKYVFVVHGSEGRRRKNLPVLAVWTADWSDEEVARCRAFKSVIKELAAEYQAKIYMTPTHPIEMERREGNRRRERGDKSRARKVARLVKALEGLPAEITPDGEVVPVTK